MGKKQYVAALVCMMLWAGGVQAFVVSYSGTIDMRDTTWTDSITFPKFDPALGELTSIKFTLSGSVQGSAQFESLDNSPTTVEMYLTSRVELQRPDGSLLVVVFTLANTSDLAAAFDGVVDFAGTSGNTYADLSGTAMDIAISATPADLALFTGPGEISLPVTAAGTSYGSGAGNLLLQFATAAGATATVEYTYVPEPITAAFLALGGMFLFYRKRRLN
ncbi:MAG TPA: choice-of-anchor E domain-containing protein [Phycisphaerae bacterium]|jgi:hypothetical protein|nr:choice-of-anchor E domain-containing protein [Phycisphaerae bacterium]HOJ56721.1 choice-of-anchor E domain-containing protein [Phycisphaerae bacterium]HOL28483.1 choice-of-anchor E domain-containing protein [Phycisphaerae bacterium]HPU34977.1 choice-of-anchor E domain-containing protein [Phycisphaerae bacterium]HXK88207.1 choice-of-anchor E domain-containing protein [Phycisphaerae bacterium]